MSDDQQPEDLRPIPDGGLKDNMPGWLKRPPAWRNMPSAEQRHERTLPEPDTSEIDPKTLVDVNDLPQWLQAIAARGDVPVPAPDQTVGHALEQIQAVSARTREPAPEAVEMSDDESIPETPSEQDSTAEKTAAVDRSEAITESPGDPESTEEDAQPMSIAIVISLCVIILALAIGGYLLV